MISKTFNWKYLMKKLVRILIELLILSIIVVILFLNEANYSNSDVAISIATVLGLVLTTVGTLIGIIAINKSHSAAMKQYDLLEREINQKLAKEIYDNLLVPLQHVLNDITSLGDSVFDKERRKDDGRGNIEIPEHIPPKLEEHANILNAKLNMLILYANDKEYTKQFETASGLSKSIDGILKSYNYREWTKETTSSLINSKKVASELYSNIVENIKQIKGKY